MQQLTKQRAETGVWKKMAALFLAFLMICILTKPCYAAESEWGPEPAPETEGEGMISSPSESSKESIFSKAVSEENGSDDKLNNLFSQIPGWLPSGNGIWSVYVCDLVNGTECSLNEGRMQAASLIKLYIMGAVYEKYETLIQQYDQSSLDSNLYSMITVSDNDAANTLVGYLGGGDSSAGMQAVNDFCMAHGFQQTSMGRLLLQSTEYGDNYTSVSDCGHFLKEVYKGHKGETTDLAQADAMFQLLSQQTRRNKIPAQLSDGVSVANKTGELSDVENDAGIIYNTEHDLVLVFMSQNLSEVGSAQNTIASVSRQIYDYYQG